ncbi:ATP-binding protein [Streptosporangium sp. NPDC051023]|uniref:ATP-binding protein n=1 Tax=Streptosporangium sp. NPDC051023 TaxID=3155410 RepID=UPI00344FC916
MVVGLEALQGDDRRAPGTTLDGWRRFVNADPPAFALLADDDWKELDQRQRQNYDEARIAYHSEMAIVTTSTITEIATEGRLLTLLNQREDGARRSLMVSGEATTGKTTAIKQLGRTHELRVRARHPGADRIPVVYVTAPPKGSPRKLAVEFAHFLQLPPVRPRHTVTDIADAICQVLVDARTDLVIVDEIHNMNLETRAGEDLSDHLKYFTEHLPATFVFAGIEVERSGVFTGIRGKQIAGRCVMIPTQAFPFNTEWKQLVAAMESSLRLHGHEPDSLIKLARYLHQRTGGTVGSLSHLIRKAAIKAILGGEEAVTKGLMDTMKIDHIADSSARRSSNER